MKGEFNYLIIESHGINNAVPDTIITSLLAFNTRWF